MLPLAILHRLVSYVSTLGGTILGPTTLHDAEGESSYDTPSTVGGAYASPSRGRLILNADDWGRDRENTDRILECFQSGMLSSASAMVFMEDSERAAALARQHSLDVGLHINLTGPFSSSDANPQLRDHQDRVRRYLKGHRFAQAVFHPRLPRSFEYVVNAQLEEYQRLYGEKPKRLDGHHHMHLCANVLLGKLMPAGTVARPSFSFYAGEKGAGNRVYRALVNGLLARRHRSADYFFSLPPLEPEERLRRIFALARTATVEVETHPVNPEEHRFLTGGAVSKFLGRVQIARGFESPQQMPPSGDNSAHGNLTGLLSLALAFGATLYESLIQFSECL